MTAFILAGGRSRRFGSNKALAAWDGKPLLAHMVNLLKTVFPRRVVLAKSPEDYAALALDVPVHPDAVDRRHPLSGVLTALRTTGTELTFLCACDMPLLRPALIEDMRRAAAGHDAVVPLWRGRLQPLCGFYSTRCRDVVEDLVRDPDARCTDLYDRVRTRFFRGPEIARTDPDGVSFLDIDTPSDYRTAREACRAD